MPARLCVLKISPKTGGAVSKDDVLENVESALKEEHLDVSYEDYIRPEMLWATENSEKIASALDVIKVVPKGGYIMGLLGGEKKKGKIKYAGLVLEQYSINGDMAYLKLTGLSKPYQAPIQLMKHYGVNIYKVYYRGLINPFKCKPYEIILSEKEVSLKDFLRALVNFNKQGMTADDRKKIEGLINELKVSLDAFDRNAAYTLYRCNRAFTAAVPEDLERAVSESHVVYIQCKSVEQAYYYTAALNYLAYKVVERKRAFIRDQFAKPLIAVIVAGLAWKDVPEDLRSEVSNISQCLSKRLQWRPYPDQRKALEETAQTEEFKRIMKLFDKQVMGMMDEALTLVSATSSKTIQEQDEPGQTSLF
ncbi:MAG: hypothetical protein QXD09_07345 [Candidatus Caldarchaeum sp.]